jgi:hypothetical protein
MEKESRELSGGGTGGVPQPHLSPMIGGLQGVELNLFEAFKVI